MTGKNDHDAFYEPDGPGVFVSTAATAGPWDASAQHAGPPAGLIARAFEHHEPVDGQRLARIAVEILRPVPLAPLTVRVRTVRPGRRITLLDGVVEAAGQPVLLARGWRIATSAQSAGPAGSEPAPDLPPDGPDLSPGGPDVSPDGPDVSPGGPDLDSRAWPNAHLTGYMAAMQWRFVSGSFAEPGPAAVWMRPRVPLVAGEDTSPASRVMMVADSGNGVSNELDPARWLFVNVDLTVALHRQPVGEWVLLDAATTIDDGGVGLATSRLADRHGTIGRGMQTLVVAPR